MNIHVVLCVLGVTWGAGWVKVANFYNSSIPDTFSDFQKTSSDLVVLVVDTNYSAVRIPLKGVDYYGISNYWAKLNETLLFGRLSFFIRNHANIEIEHNILRFAGNMSIGREDRSLLTIVNDELGFSGYMCNMGAGSDGSKVVVNICFHKILETGINLRLIQVLAKTANCRDCILYEMKTRRKSDSQQFTLPKSDKNNWNITIIEYRLNYNTPTILCQFTRKLKAGELNMVVMKPNNTVNTMFECVLFVDDVSSNSAMGTWLPVIIGLAVTCLLVLVAVLIKKHCSTACIRQLRPPPDQDAAPYRSFGDSKGSDSPTYASYRSEPDRKYFTSQKPAYTSLEERQYVRI